MSLLPEQIILSSMLNFLAEFKVFPIYAMLKTFICFHELNLKLSFGCGIQIANFVFQSPENIDIKLALFVRFLFQLLEPMGQLASFCVFHSETHLIKMKGQSSLIWTFLWVELLFRVIVFQNYSLMKGIQGLFSQLAYFFTFYSLHQQ